MQKPHPKKNEVERNDSAPEQPTEQNSGAEATPVDRGELESDYPSASNETQQWPSAVVHGEGVGKANETAAGNQNKETITAITPTPIENQRLNTGKSLLKRVAQEGSGYAEGGTKKNGLGRFESGYLYNNIFNYIKIFMV